MQDQEVDYRRCFLKLKVINCINTSIEFQWAFGN